MCTPFSITSRYEQYVNEVGVGQGRVDNSESKLSSISVDHSIPSPPCIQDNVNPTIIAKIRKDYTSSPEFDPAKIRNASTAAEGLCKWVIAIEKYER